MDWQVVFFESQRGEKPVEEFFERQQLSARTKMLHLFELLEVYGSQLGMPHSKQLGSGLYELRVRGKEEIRVLYGFKQKNIYLLHAFKKQTQKTPRKEIDTALNRLTEI
jgi:phage-related protein